MNLGQAMDDPIDKAYVYATRERGGDRQLLVFEHRDRDAGVQVPKGTVDPEEPPRDAAVRELREETGVSDVDAVTPVETDRWFYEKRGRTFRRHFFHVETTGERDRWDHVVTGGGEDGGMVFRCYWVRPAAASLVHEMDAYLDLLA